MFLKMHMLLEVGKIKPVDRFDFFYIFQMYVLMQFMIQIFLNKEEAN